MKAIIAGAGKIGRGFIAQLLHMANYELIFAEKHPRLVDQLNEKKAYTVHIMGREEKNTTVTNFKAITLDDPRHFANEWRTSPILFTSVGGKNLQGLGSFLAKAYQEMLRDNHYSDYSYNIITCENWKKPADALKDAIVRELSEVEANQFRQQVGVTEAAIMRTAVQPPEGVDPNTLDVWVQDFWDLPIDRSRFLGPLPTIEHVTFIDDFGRFLEQKIFTNNTSNATIAYLGYLKGYTYTADAAHDPHIEKVLDQVYEEVNQMLILELGIERKNQEAFAAKAKKKYSDKQIVDKLARHAADPIRKLGPDDRLIAPARLALKHGIQPNAIVKAIAAALFFTEQSDPIAQDLKQMREQKGIPFVLEQVCKLSADERLFTMILEAVEDLKKEGWLQNVQHNS